MAYSDFTRTIQPKGRTAPKDTHDKTPQGAKGLAGIEGAMNSFMLYAVASSITRDTKLEVQEEIVRLKKNYRHEREIQSKPSVMTVKEAMAKYIEDRTHVLSPSTITGYETIARVRFASLVDTPLDELTSQDIQSAINQESARVAAKTVHNAWKFLHVVLENFLPDAPRWRVTTPRVDDPDLYQYTDDDMARVLSAINDDLARKAARFAAYTGLRRSEVCGLHWDSVDIEKRLLYVRRAIIPSGKEWVEVPKTKTKRSKRPVRLPQVAVGILLSLPRDDDHVFPVKNPDVLTGAFRRANVKTVNAKGFSFHSTRSLPITIGAELGIPEKYTMAAVGHSNVQQTLHYQRIRGDQAETYTNMLNQRLEEISR